MKKKFLALITITSIILTTAACGTKQTTSGNTSISSASTPSVSSTVSISESAEDEKTDLSEYEQVEVSAKTQEIERFNHEKVPFEVKEHEKVHYEPMYYSLEIDLMGIEIYDLYEYEHYDYTTGISYAEESEELKALTEYLRSLFEEEYPEFFEALEEDVIANSMYSEAEYEGIKYYFVDYNDFYLIKLALEDENVWNSAFNEYFREHDWKTYFAAESGDQIIGDYLLNTVFPLIINSYYYTLADDGGEAEDEAFRKSEEEFFAKMSAWLAAVPGCPYTEEEMNNNDDLYNEAADWAFFENDMEIPDIERTFKGHVNTVDPKLYGARELK